MILLKCTEIFTIIMKLLCSHTIQKWLVNDDVFYLDDIHSHWHLKQVINASSSSSSSLLIDSQLQVVNSLVICLQEHSQDVCEQRVKILTQWDLSIFELVKKKVVKKKQQWDEEKCRRCEECEAHKKCEVCREHRERQLDEKKCEECEECRAQKEE